ncbi:MAG TPA: hypothetical protein VG866_02680 [Candidatus Paceibacterota bacterium]|nr:hypothetical protein [Candidatus Paceibacterota bacterium]
MGIAWIAGVAVIGAGVWYFVGHSDSNDSNPSPSATPFPTATVSPATSATGSPTASGTTSGTLQTLLGLKGGSFKCTVQHSTDVDISSGVVYISSGKLKGDFDVSAGGQSMKAYILVNGSDVYSWSSLSTTGVKTTVSASASSNQSGQGVNFNQNLNYSCTNASVDASIFAMPSGVNFISY